MCLFLTTIVTGVRWYLAVILICAFLVINNFEHFFTLLLAICTFSSEKWLLSPLLTDLVRVLLL